MQTMTVLRDEQEGCLLRRTNCGRASARYLSSQATARAPMGTKRSFRPLPRRTSSVRRSRSMSVNSNPKASSPPQARRIQHSKNGPVSSPWGVLRSACAETASTSVTDNG